MIDTHNDSETNIEAEADQDYPLHDEVSLTEEEEHSEAKIKKLQAKLKHCEQEKVAHLDELQRAKADFLNARKRLEAHTETLITRSTANHIETLLPLCDSFELAMKDPAWSTAEENWRKGVEGIYNQLQTILRSYGVTTIEALDTLFNPHEHEALRGEGDVVTEVYQTGYKLNDTVIRPAKVSVEPKPSH
jgi:molecular chaperone GrpE